MSKEELSSKVGLGDFSPVKPVMMQLLESYLSNEKPAPSSKSAVGGSLSMLSDTKKKEEEKIEPLISQ
jgi:hypothetical protein